MKGVLANNAKLKQIAKTLLIAFVILQPVFDIYMCLFDEKIQIMGMSLATVLRFLMVFVMTAAVVLATVKTKLTKGFLVYLGLVGIYAVFHHFNAIGFTVPLANATYSAVSELFHLARMAVPVALIYVILHLKPGYKDVRLMVVSACTIIASVILVSNLFCFGHIAYSLDKITVEGNMFSWFTQSDAPWWALTCRGLFQWTNQLSGAMLINLPFLTYVALKEKKTSLWVLVALYVISMLNLGTRIASFGGLAIVVGMVILHVIEHIIHKKDYKTELKNACCIAVAFVIMLPVFAFSPIMGRAGSSSLFEDIIVDPNGSQNSTSEAPGTTEKDPVGDIDFSRLSQEEKVQILTDSLSTAGVNDVFIKAYPLGEDTDFWIDLIFDTPLQERAGNRKMRALVIERVLERDGRFTNTLLGISHTRSSSLVWPERDIETQLDSLGILGFLLFVGPYFAVLAFGVWKFFKGVKNHLKISYCVYLLSAGLGVAASYFSGHIMNEFFPFVYLALMMGMAVNTAFEKEVETEE